jgi:hypothetical protein
MLPDFTMSQFWVRIWWLSAIIEEQKKSEHLKSLKRLQAHKPQAPKPHRARTYNWH